jgi:hypothetical protein
MRRATLKARAMSRPNTAADRPYSLSLAQAMAASTPSRARCTSPGRRSPRGRCASRASRGRAAWPASTCSALPPHTSLAPLATASSISALQWSTVPMPTTEPSTTGRACAGRPAAGWRPWRANLRRSRRRPCVDDDALGGHADLAAVGEAPKAAAVHRVVEVGVVEHHQRRLAAEFQHHRLQVAWRRSSR